MKHPIDLYCDDQKITRAEFARRADLSPQFLADVVSGHRHLGRESALAVVSASEGALTLDELLMPQPSGASAA